MKYPLNGATAEIPKNPDATPEELRAELATELTKQATACLWILRERGGIGGDLREILGGVLGILDSALELETGQTEFTVEFSEDIRKKDPSTPKKVVFGPGKFEYIED